MHYIKQCLEPGRILNYASEIVKKSNCDWNGRISAPKEAGMIELQLTDRCNLNCFHCHFRNQGDSDLKREWISLVMNEVKPKAISLAGGGEPTLYPDFENVIKEMKSGCSNPDIGMISNGIYIPSGDWIKDLNWIRISLYSVLSGAYGGKKPIVQELVLNNISRYMQMEDLKMFGVSLLYYRGNVVDCIRLSLELYNLLISSGRKTENFNIQFKRAFIINDPRIISHEAHQQNIEITPDVNEFIAAVKLKEELSKEIKGFGNFIDTCTNYHQISNMAISGTDSILAQTAANRKVYKNFEHCYASLVSRLITPDGFVYTCPTIAEHREHKLALGHITDSEEVFNNRLIHYYNCIEPWCNSGYCRHSLHNKIVADYMNMGISLEYDQAIQNDFFF